MARSGFAQAGLVAQYSIGSRWKQKRQHGHGTDHRKHSEKPGEGAPAKQIQEVTSQRRTTDCSEPACLSDQANDNCGGKSSRGCCRHRAKHTRHQDAAQKREACIDRKSNRIADAKEKQRARRRKNKGSHCDRRNQTCRQHDEQKRCRHVSRRHEERDCRRRKERGFAVCESRQEGEKNPVEAAHKCRTRSQGAQRCARQQPPSLRQPRQFRWLFHRLMVIGHYRQVRVSRP